MESKNEKMDELNEIKKILENKNTKIGKTINNLTKSKDERIKEISNRLLISWKKIVKNKTNSATELNKGNNKEKDTKIPANENKKTIEKNQFIQYNKKIISTLIIGNDEPLRNSSRKLIYESLSNIEKCESREELDDLKEITFELENLLYDALFNLDEKRAKYFIRVKAIVSNLKNKNNLEFKEKIIKGEIHLKNLIDMDVKDMASSEMQNKRKQAEDDGFKSRRSDWNAINSSQAIGMYNCENCKSQKTTSYQMQIRGADEPMTTFITCLDCGNQWKLN